MMVDIVPSGVDKWGQTLITVSLLCMRRSHHLHNKQPKARKNCWTRRSFSNRYEIAVDSNGDEDTQKKFDQSLADQERLSRIGDLPLRMGRRAIGTGDTSG
jgi:hypothetical protein